MAGERIEYPDLALDDLAMYIYRHYWSLLTEEERAAHRVHTNKFKVRAYKKADDLFFLPGMPEVRDRFPALMARIEAQGIPAVMNTAAQRVVREHANEVLLNHCLRCRGLCRTPTARQCFRCGHDWHDGDPSGGGLS